VVIGILAAITIVSYTGITGKANEAAIQSELSSASIKLSMYYAEYNSYPITAGLSSSTGWCPTLPATDSSYCIKFSTGTEVTYASTTSLTYVLTATKNNLTYKVTPTQSPTASVAGSDWIAVGNQLWAKTNLNVGTMVTGVTEQTNNSTIEKYCYNNDEANCITYGGLYQWDEAMQYTTTEGTQGICPTGSHIPSDNDWKILEMQLGMTQEQADLDNVSRGTDQGVQLKSGGDSGLNILIASYREVSDGSFGSLSSAYLWSSSESSSNAWVRYLDGSLEGVVRYTDVKDYGFSIRCLGD
ncbi:MAG: hypothetical protein PWQ10_382, partial [Patescibacteria group bacterium]|nr:hypothetical protein [Patescibacteria group bacterium]